MKTLIPISMTTILLITSCNNSNQGNSDLLYHVNLERDIKNVSSVPLSTLGSKLVYIPLETDSKCLIDRISDVFVSDSFIFISDSRRLLLFDSDGKHLRQIGSIGRGPGEYTNIEDFEVDKENREIYLLCSRVILVYDFKGNFKRDFKIDFPCNQFVLNENNELVLHSFNIPQPITEPVYSWYIIDKAGTIQKKLVNTLKRVNGGVAVPKSPLYMYYGTPHFMEFGIDTLFNYDNHLKRPYAIFHSGNLKFPPDPLKSDVPNIKGKIWVSDVQETKKSLFIKIWWDLSGSISNCVFDKSSSKFIILKDNGFANDIDNGLTFRPFKIQNDNFIIDYVNALNLIKHVKNSISTNNSKQSTQLESTIKNLTVASNPVLIILSDK